MANVKQDQKVQVGGAKFNKPKLRLRTRLMESLKRIFTTRQEKLAGEKGLLSTPMGRREMIFTTAVAAVAAACAPLPAIANPKEAPAAEKSKSDVKYHIISDPKDLEPYFKNAEGNIVNVGSRNWTKVGDYLVTTDPLNHGVDFNVKAKDGTYEKWGITLASPVNEVNVLVIDVPKSNPYVKGKMLVLADGATVYFQYFNKREGRHELRGVPLEEGQMRSGPIKTGFEISKKGNVDVVNAPVDSGSGDVVTMASLLIDGTSGGTFFKLA